MTIYLDMDGVCCDLVSAALKANGIAAPEKVIASWPSGEYSMENVLEIERKVFWKNIDDGGWSFWADLEEYSWFENLYDICMEYSKKYNMETFFLSSPGLEPFSMYGKLVWLQKKLGRHFRHYIFTSHKHLLANPSSILIDDSSVKINSFVLAGGNGILFPQPWNEAYERKDGKLEAVKDGLWKFFELTGSLNDYSP